MKTLMSLFLFVLVATPCLAQTRTETPLEALLRNLELQNKLIERQLHLTSPASQAADQIIFDMQYRRFLANPYTAAPPQMYAPPLFYGAPSAAILLDGVLDRKK